MKILFVCSGNICRSPMAEALLRAMLPAAAREDVELASAGTLGIEGEPAHPLACRAVGAEGGGADAHRSRALTENLVRSSDLIFVMETRHLEALQEIVSEHPGVHLLGEFLPEEERTIDAVEIRDPIGSGEEAFEACRDRIRKALEGVVKAYFAQPGPRETAPGEEEDRPRITEGEKLYFGEIRDRVDRARGGRTGLSSMEFHIADRWWRAGLALWKVLDALDAESARWPPGQAPRSFLRRVDREIDFRVSGAGATSTREESTPAAAPAAHREMEALREAGRRLEARDDPLHEALRAAIDLLEGAGDDPGRLAAARAEASLRIEEAALAAIPAPLLRRFEREERERLTALAARLSKPAFEETLVRLIRSRVLDYLNLPAL